MSATQKNNITRLEQLDRQSTQPFPNSRKVYPARCPTTRASTAAAAVSPRRR